MKLSQAEHVEIRKALDAWFTSQEVPVTDRAFICAVAAGLYNGAFVATVENPTPEYMRKGISILQQEVAESTYAGFKHMMKALGRT